jgi:hypothetical protein
VASTVRCLCSRHCMWTESRLIIVVSQVPSLRRPETRNVVSIACCASVCPFMWGQGLMPGCCDVFGLVCEHLRGRVGVLASQGAHPPRPATPRSAPQPVTPQPSSPFSSLTSLPWPPWPLPLSLPDRQRLLPPRPKGFRARRPSAPSGPHLPWDPGGHPLYFSPAALGC